MSHVQEKTKKKKSKSKKKAHKQPGAARSREPDDPSAQPVSSTSLEPTLSTTTAYPFELAGTGEPGVGLAHEPHAASPWQLPSGATEQSNIAPGAADSSSRSIEQSRVLAEPGFQTHLKRSHPEASYVTSAKRVSEATGHEPGLSRSLKRPHPEVSFVTSAKRVREEAVYERQQHASGEESSEGETLAASCGSRVEDTVGSRKLQSLKRPYHGSSSEDEDFASELHKIPRVGEREESRGSGVEFSESYSAAAQRMMVSMLWLSVYCASYHDQVHGVGIERNL